jgi:hypothetical protein
VTAFRTLHSGDLDTPMNLMFVFEVGGRRVWHEGDTNGKPEVFQAFGLDKTPIDLAVVHYWFPLEPNCARFLQAVLQVEHIALTHLPIRLEGDAPGKIDMVRSYYKDIALLLPGMPAEVLLQEPEPSPDGFFGQTPPGNEAVKFWPEVLSAKRCPHGQMAFSPDGKGVFWSAMIQEGPEQTIYYSAFDGKTLSGPVVAPFAAPAVNTPAFERFPSLSRDAKYLFFIRSTSPQFVGDQAHFYWVDAGILADVNRKGLK